MLAVSLRPPPAAFVPLSVDLQPTLTTRERVSLQTKSDNCMACHGIINPLGFTLEHFDAVGRYREKDNGKPIDATGSYKTRSGATATLSDARGLAKFLVDSDEAQTAFTEQMFHQLVQQSVQAYGPNTLADLRAIVRGRRIQYPQVGGGDHGCIGVAGEGDEGGESRD